MDYQYTLNSDFPGTVNKKNLSTEINDSSITKNLVSININENTVTITFDSSLSASEESTLATIVSSHNSSTNYLTHYYDYDESTAESSTTSTDYQMKLRLTTSMIEEGQYRITWSYNWKASKRKSSFQSKIEIDESTIVGEQTELAYDNKSYSQLISQGFVKINLSRGIHTIDLCYKRSDHGNTTVYIWNTKIEIEKIIDV